MIVKTKYIWLNGQLVNFDDAKVHVLTHTLHYGLGVFEGIRAYQTHDGRTAFFRLTDHMQRLHNSAKMYWMDLPYSVKSLCDAAKELYNANGMTQGYLRPIAFYGEGEMGVFAPNNPIIVALIAWDWGAYLGSHGLKNGIRVKISSYSRLVNSANLPKSKASGNYINSILAKREAKFDGYDEALMLDRDGTIAEASGENFFLVKDQTVYTPPLSCGILAGLTRDTVIQILQSKHIPVKQERLVREQAIIADEVFLTGTAAEVTPVNEIDHHSIGNGTVGSLTTQIQKDYFSIVKGEWGLNPHWLEYV